MTIKITDNSVIPVIEIVLPKDLLWTNEFWSPTVGTKEHSIIGKIHIQESVILTGRPITIKSPDITRGWFDRNLVDQLIALAGTEDLELELLLNDGVTYTVRFDHTKSPASFDQLWFVDEPTAAHVYSGTLNFIETTQ